MFRGFDLAMILNIIIQVAVSVSTQIFFFVVGCRSGRTELTANESSAKADRGFESPPHRTCIELRLFCEAR